MLPHALPVKNDLLFKGIFKSEDLEPLVKFLSDVLGRPESDFLKLTFQQEEQRRRNARSRLGVLDIHVSTPDGLDVDVEVQVLRDEAMPERALFYCANMYQEHIKRGDDFAVLSGIQVINISVLGYNHFQDDRPHHTFMLQETTQHITLTDVLRIDFLELSKVPKINKGNILNDLQAWILFFNATTEDKELLEMLKSYNEPLKKAVLRFEELTADEKIRAAAFQREREILAEKSRLYTAKKEGHMQGIQQGIQQGLALSAKKLLENGFSAEKTAELLGLSPEQMANLKQ